MNHRPRVNRLGRTVQNRSGETPEAGAPAQKAAAPQTNPEEGVLTLDRCALSMRPQRLGDRGWALHPLKP